MNKRAAFNLMGLVMVVVSAVTGGIVATEPEVIVTEPAVQYERYDPVEQVQEVIPEIDLRDQASDISSMTKAKTMCFMGLGRWIYEKDAIGCYDIKFWSADSCSAEELIDPAALCESAGGVFICSDSQVSCEVAE